MTWRIIGVNTVNKVEMNIQTAHSLHLKGIFVSFSLIQEALPCQTGSVSKPGDMSYDVGGGGRNMRSFYFIRGAWY